MLALALGLSAAAGSAQTEIVLSRGREVAIDGQLDAVQGTRQRGGFGFAIMSLRNAGAKARDVRVELRCASWGWRAVDFSCRRQLVLEAGESARLALPMPTGGGNTARLEVSASDTDGLWAQGVPTAANEQGPTVLYVGDDNLGAAAWQQLFEGAAARLAPPTGRGGKRTRHLGAWHVRGADGLPDRWQWLTGFDVIVVDGRARQLAGPAQRVLRQYAEGGGSLLVLAPQLIAAGPLTEALANPSPLGRWLAFDDAGPTPAAPGQLDPWLQPIVERTFADDRIALAGPVPTPMHTPLGIRGLGDVPVRLFFVFILAFAVVVGPVSHFVAYRKRKPLLMLFTVPALGLGCTALFLAIGLLSEGFGIQGAIRSITLLDQREHHAVSTSGRTLYAGLSPAALTPRSGTYLYSPAPVSFRGYQQANPYDLDLNDGSIGGAILPSRNPTTFLAVSQGPCRERLRFRRRDDGGLEMLVGPDLRPSAVWLRDFDERLYRSGADGRMVAAAEAELPAFLASAEKALALEPARDDIGRLVIVRSTPARARSILPPDLGLEPGTYLALVDRVSAADDFGLTVDYLDAAHVVKGLLAEEDIVE